MRARLFIAVWFLACAPAFGAEEAVILTPQPGPAPRINGARVFGARPGSPFLFTIAATGERPIRFGAEGLPAGLRLDPANGRISGSVAIAGAHAATLSATNRHGTAKRPFRIVIGDTLALTPHMGWNDPDYLLLGYLSDWKGATAPTPLTPNEQYTHVSLWSLVAAPLIFSGDVTRLDPFTLSLLTNDEVIDVDQDPLGKPGRRVLRRGPLEVWARDLEDGSRALGLFNRGEGTVEVTAAWADVGLSGKQTVRDLWRQRQVGVFDGKYATPVGRHGVVMVRLTPVR
jgi:hypothetical protein